MSAASQIAKDPAAPPMLRQFALTWLGIISRTTATHGKTFKIYGARGIKVWPGWIGDEGFWRFATWAALELGDRPGPGYSIDRINNNGDYVPGNLRWATARQQASNTRRNRFVTIGSETMTISEAARRLGISVSGFTYRIKLETQPRPRLSPKPKHICALRECNYEARPGLKFCCSKHKRLHRNRVAGAIRRGRKLALRIGAYQNRHPLYVV